MLLGAMTNGLLILAGGMIGAKAGKLIPERHSKLIMTSLQIIVLVLGIGLAIKTENILITVISLVLGGLLGETIDLDGKMKIFGDWIQSKASNANNAESS